MTAAAAAAASAAPGDLDAEQEPAELSEAYVHSLASLGLERLQNEPGRLHAEAVAVDEVGLKRTRFTSCISFCEFFLSAPLLCDAPRLLLYTRDQEAGEQGKSSGVSESEGDSIHV